MFASLERAVKEDNTLPTNLNVKDIMSSWTDQAGFPVLKVNRNYDDNSIILSQERYFNQFPIPQSNMQSWWIPYNFDTANNVEINQTAPSGWFPKGATSEIIRPDANKKWSTDDWVLFNKQQIGFYRVLYDDQNYKMILNELISGKIDKIHPISRSQLINDIGEFVNNNLLPHTICLHLLKYLKRETSYAPWKAAIRPLTHLVSILVEKAGKNSEEFNKFQDLITELVSPFEEINKEINLVKRFMTSK